MASHTDSSMFLFNVPPSRMEKLCKIIDSGDGSLGWRDLAARILPNWSELRQNERLEAAGKSPTSEILWSWAQKNKTVGDLLLVLEDMGHERALDVFRSGGAKPVPKEWPSHCEDSSQEPSDSWSGPEELRYSPCAASQGRPLKHSLTYGDVKEGTSCFHHSSKIGDSTFSEVYKGSKGDRAFAVKVFKQEKNASWKELWDVFRTEMEILHHKPHPNILELWGCFLEGDRYCLVTPYLPNGSLSQWLHEQGAASLSWRDRLNIVKGTARAISHLHTAPPCGVICGNLTSENILLGEQLEPKLSDFGQARLKPYPLTHGCTVTLDAFPLGTLGYLPEEYIRYGKLSTAVDVYSLGVVMMETLTGQRAVLPKQIPLRERLCREVERSGGLDVCLSLLDPRAGPWPQDTALGLFRVALDCTASRPKTRPSMHRVVEVLSQMLPRPAPPPDDLPRTLEDWGGAGAPSSLPEEHDETQGPAPQPGPCECSQSEATFLSDAIRGAWQQDETGAGQSVPFDLYSSWPVQCSCAPGDGQECEDCVSNGFATGQSHTDAPAHGPGEHVPNQAKERFINKIQRYNQGLINTEELLSMSRD
ncbi:hypothetical protein COCON_G00231610 [Conger conger]|uniref:Protein kinase domain-containing protein n=1 Tax=Conger conger TaxID=82655 RepID=A0A9Q1HJX4_CONCO|nr:hypothetical protein COCON_G00231610 [Conger conger]